MSRQKKLLAGYISKPHGTGGRVLVRLEGDFSEYFNIGEPVFLEIDETQVPFFILETEELNDKIILRLQFIDSLDQAMQYSGCKVFLDMPDPGTVEKGIRELIGYKISDESSGMTGIITGISGTEMNLLFEIRSEDREYYIPIHPDLIAGIDHKKKSIIFKLPEGFAGI
jgi:16S rRNA processing protein RimM